KRLWTNYRLIPRNINQNIEAVLFGYELFAPIKEMKAEFNFRLFNRHSPLVYVSDNGVNLYAMETVDTTNNYSSFKAVSDEEIDKIVSNMNYISDEYKKRGFDEVVFSIT